MTIILPMVYVDFTVDTSASFMDRGGGSITGNTTTINNSGLISATGEDSCAINGEDGDETQDFWNLFTKMRFGKSGDTIPIVYI